MPIAMLETLRDSDGHICIHDLPNEFRLVEEGDWTQEHKYQGAQHIVQHVASGQYFGISQSRSGSHFSDWYYDASEIYGVHQVTETVVVTKWVVN